MRSVAVNMALHDVEAEYVLLDGNLDRMQEIFRFTPAGMELPPQPKKKWYQGNKEPVNHHEIVVGPNQGFQEEGMEFPIMFGADCRQIAPIIRACSIPVCIIGASGDPAKEWRGDVDYDLGMRGIKTGLIDLIDRLEAQKANS